MKNLKWILFFVALGLMAGTVALLKHIKAGQRLGAPGIVAMPMSNSVAMKIELPERVLDFTSTNVEEPEVVRNYLPKDTSYVERYYESPDGAKISGTIVMMGADRTSIHKPDYCLPGQGWHIDSKAVVNVPIAGEHPYDLPVSRWFISTEMQAADGTKTKVGGVYVFWFVTKNHQTSGFYDYLKHLTLGMFTEGILQRWAYVSYFTSCAPGQEEAAFAKIEKLISASVPEFQLPPEAGKAKN